MNQRGNSEYLVLCVIAALLFYAIQKQEEREKPKQPVVTSVDAGTP